MKNKFLQSMAASFGLAMSANAALVLNQTGLVAHYTFEGADTTAQLANKATADPTAQNYAVTLPDGGVTVANGSLSGNAATTDGSTTARLNTTYSRTELGASYTIGAYFYFPSTTTARQYAFETENGFDLSLGTASTRTSGATTLPLLSYADSFSGGTANAPTDAWVQLAVVVSGDTVSYYQNGVEFDTGLGGNGTIFDGFNFLNARNGQNRGAAGSVDEIFIYNRALSVAELQAIPEPSAIAFIGLAGLGLLIRRR